MLKFFLDKLFALLWFLLTSPLMGFIALAIKAEGLIDPATAGPVLETDIRITQGCPFGMYKFRTTSDGRRTRVGHYLKKWYLDELPQCANIFKGEMTFVGP
ncbi:MAG: sugar transferase, partial [Dehalococcoidia bacterium]